MDTDSSAPAIPHLYFFDDLSYHVKRIMNERAGSHTAVPAAIGTVRQHLHAILGCLDPAQQDYTLVPWDHAVHALAYELNERQDKYDFVISQGCNGEYAMNSLLEVFSKKAGRDLCTSYGNVRIAHMLVDSSDAFHSEFQLKESSGPKLRSRVVELLDDLDRRSSLNVAVFDDCIQTGKGTQKIVDLVEEATKGVQSIQVSTIGFLACESTQAAFSARGYQTRHGVLLRGDAYPKSWDYDVYFLKDLLLPNSIRFVDGTSRAYMDDKYWMARIFGNEPECATQLLRALRSELQRLELYDALVEL